MLPNMSDCIHLLPQDVINQVAAGEVIERPAAVLKELIENSLDADAKEISIQIRRAGKDFIQIRDDGSGMSRNDALSAVQSHTTSKILDINDLHSIRTFGFRGEALSSIASISRFQLRTRRQQDAVGTEILIDGGQWISAGDCAMMPGTEITVTQLFKNVPARRKFLKTDLTENNHLLKVGRLFVLDFPAVQFSIILDGREALKTSGNYSSETLIRQLWGDAFWQNLMPIDQKNEFCHLSGFVAHPGLQAMATPEMIFFVNRRAIDGGILRDWLLEVYREYWPEARAVSCFLFLDLPPSWVDINVHPTKREVRFSHRGELKSFLQNSLNATISSEKISATFSPQAILWEEVNVAASPSLIFQNQEKVSPKCKLSAANFCPNSTEIARSDQNGKKISNLDQNDAEVAKSNRNGEKISRSISDFKNSPLNGQNQLSENLLNCPPKAENFANNFRIWSKKRSPLNVENQDDKSLPINEVNYFQEHQFSENFPLRWIGKMNSRCVILASQSGLLFFDIVHVRERIEFEKILREMDLGTRQKLLLPLQIAFHNKSDGEIREMQRQLEPLGFEFEAFGPKTWRVTALPNWLEEKSGESFLYDWLILKRKKSQELHREYIAQLASTQLARSANPQPEEEIFKLLEKLFQCRIPVRSPAGKRTYFEIPYSDIQRRW